MPSNTPALDYTRIDGPVSHVVRARAILAAHPEIRQLYGNDPRTAVWTVLLVLVQLGLAAALSFAPWWLTLLAAFGVGAVIDHALFAVIHEATHNLVFRRARANRWLGLVANAAGVVPSAAAFRGYHLLHHRYLGEMGWDADLAGPTEARLVGNRWWRKVLWFFVFSIVEGLVRPLRLKKVRVVDRWGLANLAITGGIAAAMLWAFGPMALVYLLVSTFFSIGLHPVGGRWIQEHYLMRPGQETYSYYGPGNRIAFNVGYHNEHHDFARIPGSRLPRVKALAPEFYEPLYAHRSWTRLLLRFLFDPRLTLYSRMVRPDHTEGPERKAPAASVLAKASG